MKWCLQLILVVIFWVKYDIQKWWDLILCIKNWLHGHDVNQVMLTKRKVVFIGRASYCVIMCTDDLQKNMNEACKQNSNMWCIGHKPWCSKDMFCVYTHFMMRNVSSFSFVIVSDGATESGYCVWPNTSENIWRQYDSHGDTHARPLQDCRNAHSACEFLTLSCKMKTPLSDVSGIWALVK